MDARELVVLGWGLLLAGAVAAAPPPGPLGGALPPCEPGYRWVEETCYKEVEHEVCKLVPETKKVKKTVYSTKESPFCLRRSGLKALLGGQDGCGEGCCGEGCLKCKGPYPHRTLVKTVITCEEPTVHCVIEKVVERVPYTVLRKVACDTNVTPGAAPSCSVPCFTVPLPTSTASPPGNATSAQPSVSPTPPPLHEK